MNDPLQKPLDPIECPFCKNKYAPRLYGWHERLEETGKVVHRYSVRCLNCGAQGPKNEFGPHAIAAWNRRAQPATPAMTIPAGALDAMDRCLDRLVAIFDDDANTMPDQLLDDYLISRNWIDAQDVAWIEAQKERQVDNNTYTNTQESEGLTLEKLLQAHQILLTLLPEVHYCMSKYAPVTGKDGQPAYMRIVRREHLAAFGVSDRVSDLIILHPDNWPHLERFSHGRFRLTPLVPEGHTPC